MYNYMIGKITGYDKSSIILENNGIGYQISVANPYNFKIDNEYKIYIYSHIKEDEHSLYGFKSNEEKDLFLKLINVKGIGPKMAIPLFSGDNISAIYEAINSDNVTYLTRFPKIGDKIAKQIILDLKGKLTTQTDLFSRDSKELIECLESLGYKTNDIKKIISKVDISQNIQVQIKEALKLLGR